MAVYCLLAKYAKVDSQHLIDLEQHFIQAPHHFSTGSPINKVNYLQDYLTEVLEMGVQLKASQTIIPIVDILSQRHNKFAIELAKYAEGGDSPNDCAATLEELFSDIVRTCSRIENATGSESLWQTQTFARSALIHGKGKGPSKGKGASKGKGKGKGMSKGMGKGMGKGGKGKGCSIQAYAANTTQTKHGQPAYGHCWAQGCNTKSGHFRFCTEHYKQGMEQGYLICYNGYKQEVSRAQGINNKRERGGKSKERNKDNNTFGFSKDNLRGMAALSEHLSEHVSTLLNERLGVAHHVEPFKHEQQDKGIWSGLRIKEGKVAEAHRAKKQKTEGFLGNLAKISSE